jgi:hypothetical protein
MLLERYPNAFLLLTQISLRAWWKKDEKSPVGLEYGQAFIGDYRSIGLTEKGYRVAKQRLAKGGLATFKGANKGTIATLIDSRVYSLSKELEGGPRADNRAGKGRAKGGEGATNSHTHTQSHHNNTPQTPKGDPELALDDLPHSERFRKSWHEWEQYRKERKKKITPTTRKKQLTQLSKLNENDAIASIEQSITNGWTGLFDPKPAANNHRSVGTLNQGRTYGEPAGGNAPRHVEGIS